MNLIRGYSAEHEVIADLIRKGYTPCQPLLPSSPFDIIAVKDDELIKVQIKSGEFAGNVMKVCIRRSVSKGTGRARRYKGNEVDLFAIHDVITRETAYVPYIDASQITMYKEHPEIKAGFRSDQAVRVFKDYLGVKASA